MEARYLAKVREQRINWPGGLGEELEVSEGQRGQSQWGNDGSSEAEESSRTSSVCQGEAYSWLPQFDFR